MSREQIIEKLKEIMTQTDDHDAQSISTCTEDSELRTDLGLTSVGMLYTMIIVEETFGITFDNVGMSDFVKVKDVVDHIEKALKEKN